MATTKQKRNNKNQMQSRGINVVVDKKGKVLSGNKAAGFDYATRTIYIRKKTGVIDLYHEGFLAEQYLNIDQKNIVVCSMKPSCKVLKTILKDCEENKIV